MTSLVSESVKSLSDHNCRLELRDEWRLENRKAFANIWSDFVFGVSLFILLYFNESKVSSPPSEQYLSSSKIYLFASILVSSMLLGKRG